jgi:antitoxin (DNA-binding transcriptional repressor) of toxin-antitoxin stability system
MVINQEMTEMGEISVARAKAQFAALVSRAEAGERIIVTRNRKAVACLGPLSSKRPIGYGDLSHLWLADDLSLPEDIIDLMANPRFEGIE